MNKFTCFVFTFFYFMSVVANASEATVFTYTVEKPMTEVYDKVYASLEDARFYVVLEPNIGKNMQRFKDKWGKTYNQNNLTAYRSMVFCNVWYANAVSNKDINMTGLCPLHVTLIEKDNRTTAIFNRPTALSPNGPALEVLKNIEDDVTKAIINGLEW